MCLVAILRRTTAALLIVGALLTSAKTQPSTTIDQASVLVEMLANIKSAVESGRHNDVPAVYKTISIRLVQCAIMYRMLGGNPESAESLRTSYVTGSNVFFRAASALYPGDALAFRQEMQKLQDQLLDVQSDKQRLFYFLRSCRDLSRRESIRAAIAELLL